MSAPLILTVEDYLSNAVSLDLRKQYDEGLNSGRFVPHGTVCTDIPLSQVTDDLPLLNLHLDVAERLRLHFDLPPLRLDYCAYTRILPEGSHILHADALTLDGTPNHTKNRVVAAMLYLSDGVTDFQGGSLRFPLLATEFVPRVGLLVGFLSGLIYMHEVPPVTLGVRDALAMWFQLANPSDGTQE